ncbi:hypothetical protein MBLNU230_g6964t1 [Neophaeotheca triangularis]
MSREQPDLPKNREPCALPSQKSTSSFWHTEPSPLLTAHRSTRDLPSTADVVIVGSGITGASVAHHLFNSKVAADLNVVMLEAREACWGATGRNGGHCQPLLFEYPNDPEIGRFELDNFHTLKKLIDDHNVDCEWSTQPGVRAIYSKHHLNDAELAVECLEDTAPDLAKHVKIETSKEALRRLRIPTATGAVVTDLAARLWPYKLVAHILEQLISATNLSGTFNLQTLTPVTSTKQSTDGKSWSVSTPRGEITTSQVILATNAYTSHLLPSFSDLIVPCRGQMSALAPPDKLAGENRLTTSFGFLGDGLDDYLIQRPNSRGGHLMFGGGRQHGPSIGVTDDSVIDDKTAAYLSSRLVKVLTPPNGPDDDSERPEKPETDMYWSGIMGFSRDEHPWVGPLPEQKGLFIAAGFTGHGMPNTWLSGKAVAVMVREATGGAAEAEALEAARSETGLPKSYLVTQRRIEKAMGEESVDHKDWAEMDRGRLAGA